MADTPEIKSDNDQLPKVSQTEADSAILEDGLSLVRLTETDKEERVGVAKPADSLLGEGLYSAAYSLHSAGKGVLQLAGQEDLIGEMDIPAPAEFGSARWHAQQVGGAAGIIAPFMLTHKGVQMASRKIAPTRMGAGIARYLDTPGKVAIAEGAIAGGTFEFLAKPTQEGDSIWTRPKNFAVGAATFGTLTASTIGIKSYASGLSRPMAQRMLGNNLTANTLSGVPAGFAHTLSHDVMYKGTDFSKYSGLQDYGKNAYTFGVVGLGLGLKDVGVAGAKKALGIEEAPGFHALVEKGEANRSANERLLSGLRVDINAEAFKPTESPVAAERAPSLAEQARALVERVVPERPVDRAVLENTVLAGSDGAKTGETFKVYDVPQEVAPRVKEGFSRALEAVKTGSEAKAGEFLEFAADPANAPAAKFIIEAAHIKNDPVLIDLVGRVYQLSPEVNSALRGEALAKAASDSNAAAPVKEAFVEWARTEGVNDGHGLIRMGQSLGKPEIAQLAIETYRGIEGSPLAKEIRMGESIAELANKHAREYKEPGEPVEPVPGTEAHIAVREASARLATETVAGRLRRQVDPAKEVDAETFNFERFNERMVEFDRGLEMLNRAHREGTEIDTAKLTEYAQGDGARVGKALLEWSYIVDNPGMVKALEKAYGFDYSQSKVIEGEALARASLREGAPDTLFDRFVEYTKNDGVNVGDYLLSEAVSAGDPVMEHAVVIGYAHAPNSRLGASMMKGVELIDAAAGKTNREGEAVETSTYSREATESLVEFAMGEGAHLGRALEKLVEVSDADPRATTALKEAYLFAQNQGRRDVGDAQLRDLRYDTDVMEPFFDLISRVPSNPAEYAAFKAQVLDFIARNRREITNPDQPDRAIETGYHIETNPNSPNFGKNIFEIIASESAYSSVAGPIDYYFRTNNGLGKFPEVKAIEYEYSEVGPGGEAAPRSLRYQVDKVFPEFEASTGGDKLFKAHELADMISGMTPKQFREWMAYGQTKVEGSELTNFDRMGIAGAKVLNRPELVEAVRNDTTGDGALKSFKDMLVPEKAAGEVEAVPDWMNQHISMKLSVARARLGENATPGQILKEALPEWLVQQVAGGRVRPNEEGFIRYGDLNPDLVQVLDGVRTTEPNLFNKLVKPQEAPKPETLQQRFDRLERMLALEGPGATELATRLRELAGDNPRNVDPIIFRLNPERSPQEYRELVEIVAEGAKSLDDVALLMKIINEGNNLHRAKNPRDRNHRPDITDRDVQVNQELAISMVNEMAGNSARHGRALELADGLIQGRYRPPRNDGGRPGGGRFDNRSGGRRDRGGSKDEGGGRPGRR